VLADWQQVPTITRHKNLDSGRHRARKDHIVITVARDRLRRLRWRGYALADKLEQERPDFLYSILREAKLRRQHTLELDEDGVCKHKLDTIVNRCLDYPARRPAGDESRHQNVRVAERTQGSRPRRAQLGEEPLDVLGADTPLLRAPAPVALQVGEALVLNVTAQCVAHHLALGLARRPSERLGLGGKLVRNRHGKQTRHMKSSYQPPGELG
jgi:hypothetical protein